MLVILGLSFNHELQENMMEYIVTFAIAIPDNEDIVDTIIAQIENIADLYGAEVIDLEVEESE
jgi:hypothetical protein